MEPQCNASCFEEPGMLQPDPDIGGVGVIVVLLGTAWLSVILVTLRYCLAFDPKFDAFYNPERDHRHKGRRLWKPNPFDVKVANIFAPIRRILGLHSGGTAAMDKIFLLLYDIQILTGFGILLANYLSLRCYMSSYHWQTNTYLAWFSNLTHAACLSAIRGHLYRNKIERNFRMIAMTALVIMLIFTMVPTVYFNWRETSSASAASLNARCFFSSSTAQKLWDDDQPCENRNSFDGCTRRMKQSLGNSHAFQSAVLSFVLLIFNFASRSAKLYRTISVVARITLREEVARGAIFCLYAVSRSCKRWGSSPILIWIVSIIRPLDILIAFYLLAKFYTDWFLSELTDMVWLLTASTWGTVRLFYVRKPDRSGDKADDSENEWGFGQILPVLLLIGPVVGVSVSALGAGKNRAKLWNENDEQSIQRVFNLIRTYQNQGSVDQQIGPNGSSTLDQAAAILNLIDPSNRYQQAPAVQNVQGILPLRPAEGHQSVSTQQHGQEGLLLPCPSSGLQANANELVLRRLNQSIILEEGYIDLRSSLATSFASSRARR